MQTADCCKFVIQTTIAYVRNFVNNIIVMKINAIRFDAMQQDALQSTVFRGYTQQCKAAMRSD